MSRGVGGKVGGVGRKRLPTSNQTLGGIKFSMLNLAVGTESIVYVSRRFPAFEEAIAYNRVGVILLVAEHSDVVFDIVPTVGIRAILASESTGIENVRRAGIVRCQHKLGHFDRIFHALELMLQTGDVFAAGTDVVFRKEEGGVVESEFLSGNRHQLHETTSATRADCIGIEAAFMISDSGQELPIPSDGWGVMLEVLDIRHFAGILLNILCAFFFHREFFRFIVAPDIAFAGSQAEEEEGDEAGAEVGALLEDDVLICLGSVQKESVFFVGKLVLDEFDEHVDSGRIVSALRNDHIGITLARFDELLVHGFENTLIAVEHNVGRTSALNDVATDNADETIVGIRINEDAEIHLIAEAGVAERKDTFDDDYLFGLNMDSGLLTGAGDIIVGRLLDSFAFAELTDMLFEEVPFESVGMVEIDFASLLERKMCSIFVVGILRDDYHLALRESLRKLLDHRSFTRAGAARNADNEHT